MKHPTRITAIAPQTIPISMVRRLVPHTVNMTVKDPKMMMSQRRMLMELPTFFADGRVDERTNSRV